MIIIVWLFNYFILLLFSVSLLPLVANWAPTSSGCSHDLCLSILFSRPWSW